MTRPVALSDFTAHTLGRGPLDPNHFTRCKACQDKRRVSTYNAQLRANVKACARAAVVGARVHKPLSLGHQAIIAKERRHQQHWNAYQADVKHIMGGCRDTPASEKSVTIQIPYKEKPVTTLEVPSPRSRKRGYNPIDEPDIGIVPLIPGEPLPRLLQIALYKRSEFTTQVPSQVPLFQPEPAGSPASAPAPAPSRSAEVDASCQRAAQLTPGAFPSWADAEPEPEPDWMDIDSDPALPNTPPSPNIMSMPGAWPLGPDDRDEDDYANVATPSVKRMDSWISLFTRGYFNVFNRTLTHTQADGGPQTSKRVRISPFERPGHSASLFRRSLASPPTRPLRYYGIPPSSTARPDGSQQRPLLSQALLRDTSAIQPSSTITPEGSQQRPFLVQTPPRDTPATVLPPGDPKYTNLGDLLNREEEITLPGSVPKALSPSSKKVDELGEQKTERINIEEKIRVAKERVRQNAERERIAEERLRAAKEHARAVEEFRRTELNLLGLRKPKATLITPLSSEWDHKARATVKSGKAQVPNPEGTEVTPHDFGTLVPESAWLNDNIIQAVVALLAQGINNSSGVVLKKDAPKCVGFSPLFWQHITEKGPKGVERRLKRTWGVTPENFLQIDTFLFPINLGNHWTLMAIRPSLRTMAYVDSFRSAGMNHLNTAKAFLASFLGDKYDKDEWNTVKYRVPQQTNSYDCGMFVITNAIYLALGLDPSEYKQSDMPLMRRRMAAMLLNGGFTGDFSLASL
ncbi:hypothetical protein SLS62_002172 [Diatrype stigma]|uniref:Ubiquitin-like protease family profile domain-containing protein n=1 Tax=Diatrype stigma TaxID=117547 RepID=A0AAN9YVZ8_9PEZI